MAKIKSGIISISGKMGENVLVSGGKYKNHIRTATKKTPRLHPSLEKQNNRTAIVNGLAGELTTIIKAYGERLTPAGFYHKLLRIFRKEQESERFLLLMPLRQMEINPVYRFGNLGLCTTSIEEMKDKVRVNLVVGSHPPRTRYGADCYFYEVTWVHWSKNKPGSSHSRQYSDWISMKGKLSEFDFIFRKPAAATHWLLLMRIRLGKDQKPLDFMATEGMMIVEAGSFDKKEQALWEKKQETVPRKPIPEWEDVVRVKAKN